MKRIFTTLAAASLPALFAWFGGYDFDHRGELAFTLALCALWFGGLVYSSSEWDE